MKLDDRITWALLLALALQAAAALIWTGAASARLAAAEAHIAAQEPTAERLARLEASLDDTRASLARIERRLDDAA